MSDMLSTFHTEATARLTELDQAIADDDSVIEAAQAAREARSAERKALRQALAGIVKRTRQTKPSVAPVDEL